MIFVFDYHQRSLYKLLFQYVFSSPFRKLTWSLYINALILPSAAPNNWNQQCHLQIKQDVQDIIQSEMERLLNDPGLTHLVVRKG